ncbi:hypothetical protein TNCV_412721 [Trichonephila clavipes]|nr:hypothetical protein TNCV_412721 [Trichonephila clavipes]
MIVQFRNEKVTNHGSIPITIDCNVVAFIVFEEGFHQPIKRTKQSVFLDVEKADSAAKAVQAVDGSAELSCFVPADELSCLLLLTRVVSFLVPTAVAGGRRQCRVELFRSCGRVQLFSPAQFSCFLLLSRVVSFLVPS